MAVDDTHLLELQEEVLYIQNAIRDLAEMASNLADKIMSLASDKSDLELELALKDFKGAIVRRPEYSDFEQVFFEFHPVHIINLSKFAEKAAEILLFHNLENQYITVLRHAERDSSKEFRVQITWVDRNQYYAENDIDIGGEIGGLS